MKHSKGEQLLYAVVLMFMTFVAWLRKHTNNIALTVLMLGMVGAGAYGAYDMYLTGKEHEVDALYLEQQYVNQKRTFALACLKEGRGFSKKGEQMNPEVIEACENMATAMYPDKDFSKVAMLNWERQQLGIVIYESDEDR